MDFCKNHFVVEAFEFGEERVDECECGFVLEGVELSWGVLGDEGMGRGTQEGSLSGGECDMRTSGSMAAGNRGGLVAPRV